jgi:hypothetical protein
MINLSSLLPTLSLYTLALAASPTMPCCFRRINRGIRIPAFRFQPPFLNLYKNLILNYPANIYFIERYPLHCCLCPALHQYGAGYKVLIEFYFHIHALRMAPFSTKLRIYFQKFDIELTFKQIHSRQSWRFIHFS